jgi:ATP-binding cassette, subfamily B, bacterial HlyB/CyaB
MKNLSLHALIAIARRKGLDFSIDQLLQEFDQQNLQPADIVRAAKSIGLYSTVKEVDSLQIGDLGAVFPLLCFLKHGDAGILAGVVGTGSDRRFALINPQTGQLRELPLIEFDALYAGKALLLKAASDERDPSEKFSLRWFIPQILKQKKAFGQIALATLALGLVGLGVPLFTQQVIDKVLVHQNMATLVVLTIAVSLAIVFEVAFEAIRTYLQNAAVRKIDLRLNLDTFKHLLNLPIEYFETRAAGLIVRQLQQVTVIRGFLTGSIFFTALECVMFIIFLPILMIYSIELTLVVIAFSVLMAALTYSLVGPFRRRLEKTAAIESQRQGMLVESVHGVRTVKALALERVQHKAWEGMSANVMNLAFGVLQISMVANGLTSLLQRFMTVGIIVVGSFLVLDGALSLGMLIGFQMLSARITGPIGMLVGLIHEYQQIAVATGMVADFMDKPQEMQGKNGVRSKIRGSITFDGLGFRYPSASTKALDNFSLDIKEGEVIGLVGKSGSGKSTIAKLLQGLYFAQEGVLRIDNVDIREYELTSLRKQVGIVLQDSFLFKGTIRENILAARPAATHEHIVAAARAAGADEFIEKLPKSYDTLIEESASNLSGGQKQRIAIARAIIAGPKILIFDEATSALDPETESIVMKSLKELSHNRTVVLISHRLATLTTCDRIAFLENGVLLNVAPHNQLLEICPPYKHLWGQQNTYHLGA